MVAVLIPRARVQRSRGLRVRRRVCGTLGAVLVVGGAVTGVGLAVSGRGTPAPVCTVTALGASYTLSPAQAQNATTIAAVGRRMGLPDHAVTVALAAAQQESGLLDLDYGDRDSLGLFQQRPSQGWGRPDQILVPGYAAAAFFTRLTKVPAWTSLSVAEAAQSVQHSAAPAAYADWAPESRSLAVALTGEVPAGITCAYIPGGPVDRGAVLRAGTNELGSAPAGALPAARGWTDAAWLVGHGQTAHLSWVSFSGRRWTARSGKWAVDPTAGLLAFG